MLSRFKKWVNMLRNKGKKKVFSKMERECIRKFYFAKLPMVQKASQTHEFLGKFGQDFASLGIEMGLDACESLFEEGKLQLCAQNSNEFIVYMIINEEIIPIYEEPRNEE